MLPNYLYSSFVGWYTLMLATPQESSRP
uniref:Uncharacterized protein n=1 Tax=Musa acuminata subsp. malaccensis TaxID=214687 RepID=A0A804K9L0_MUSAM